MLVFTSPIPIKERLTLAFERIYIGGKQALKLESECVGSGPAQYSRGVNTRR